MLYNKAASTVIYEGRGKQMSEYKTIDQLPKELNIRDLGGLPTKDGRHVKKGLIIRSSALAFFDKHELAPVRDLGLKTILDFRAAKGVKRNPDPVLPGADYYNRCAAFQNYLEDLNSPAALASLIFDADQRGNLIDVLVSSYSASLAFSNDSYQFMFDCLLDGRAPLLFHCSNGKDRTGVAAMLIPLALGVPVGIVKEDYLKSNISRQAAIDHLMKKYNPLSGVSGSTRSLLTMIEGVLPGSAYMMMTEIQEKYGTYTNYMYQEYGFDREKLMRLRDMYLE